MEPHVCCAKLRCSERYGCVPNDVSGVCAIAWFRKTFQNLSQESRRIHIHDFMSICGKKKMHFYNLGELQAMYTKNIMERKLNRPITDADNVCHDFFCYMTGTSEKSLSQPTVACRHTMFVTDKTRVQPRPREVTDGIVRWLEYIAQFYLHDPTANLVQLPCICGPNSCLRIVRLRLGAPSRPWR